ncbi:hypothetical protein KTT_23690 [Tengunoibacter tsumagoiensis]|uniref:NACHT domain-containing protein n=1 Tax=Tengunoibacter tsumagoiensis TaxID=2014871 RepID=A0A402A035_9CHLR|nr:hypothetical protein KTT_23690 [Tengunoibacter tsumagoiensis]
MLILGEPGAGKTTLLLELASNCIEHALQDDTQPFPFVFLLSSWSEKYASFYEWLIQQLMMTYLVPSQLAHKLMLNDQIFPLLDGLDEVNTQSQAACIKAINAYRQKHGLMPMVVTCRSADYNALPNKLLLTSAVVVKPLSTQQIDEYVFQKGAKAWKQFKLPFKLIQYYNRWFQYL